MRSSLGIVLVALLQVPLEGAERVLSAPRKLWPTAVGIVVDTDTARELEPEIRAWRDAVEADGWATWLVVDRWTRCEDVREVLMKLAREAPAIEGAVLVGQVPHAEVVGVEHLVAPTTRELLTQRGPWLKNAAIVGDAYYADFDLRFDALASPAGAGDVQRFALSPESSARIERELFVARIQAGAPAAERIERLRRFFAAAARAHAERRELTHIVAVGPLSEQQSVFESWLDCARECLPDFRRPGRALVNVLPRSERETRSGIARQLSGPDLDAVLIRGQSGFSAALADVILSAATRARVVLNSDVTGEAGWSNPLLFGSSATVATADGIGGDVESPTALGLLALGEAIGRVQRRSPYFEAGLHGDPTLAFATGALSKTGRGLLDVRSQDDEVIDALCGPSAPAVLRAQALVERARRSSAGGDSGLVQAVKSDPSMVVRLAALEALARRRSELLPGVLRTALSDPAEVVRANVALLMGEIGRGDFLAPLLTAYLNDASPRVVACARAGLLNFDVTLITNAVDDWSAQAGESAALFGTVEALDALVTLARAPIDARIALLADPQADQAARARAIYEFCEQRVHRALEPILAVATSADAPQAVRAAAIDTLSWYAYSPRRAEITRALRSLSVDEATPADARRAARVAADRLDAGPNAPLMF
ncbi:MAG: HEAT repeat domain-containing protein [Planctomycetes bacterium]|nr:HEAT repeat domain-containing protein [Planctomycetota bacterium]